MKRFWIVILLIVMLFFRAAMVHAFWWMFYHKPAFQGRVVDSETKQPIEGAVVVVTYSKNIFRFMPESGTVIMDVKETPTDKEGMFYFPSYTTVIDPLAWEEWARFIIFKPGYGSFPNYQVSPPKVGINPEDFFSKEETGTKGVMVWRGIGTKFDVTFGIVELPKLKTREEIEKRMLGFPAGFGAKELPLLYKAYEDEKKIFDIRK